MGICFPTNPKMGKTAPNSPRGSTFLSKIQGSHNSWDGFVPAGSQISPSQKKGGSREVGSLWKLPQEFQPWIQGSATAGGWKIPGFGNLFGISSLVFLSTEGFPSSQGKIPVLKENSQSSIPKKFQGYPGPLEFSRRSFETRISMEKTRKKSNFLGNGPKPSSLE